MQSEKSPQFMKGIFSETARKTRCGRTFYRPKIRSVKRSDRSLRRFGPIVWNTLVPGNCAFRHLGVQKSLFVLVKQLRWFCISPSSSVAM